MKRSTKGHKFTFFKLQVQLEMFSLQIYLQIAVSLWLKINIVISKYRLRNELFEFAKVFLEKIHVGSF